jgi:hypothetical protein
MELFTNQLLLWEKLSGAGGVSDVLGVKAQKILIKELLI